MRAVLDRWTPTLSPTSLSGFRDLKRKKGNMFGNVLPISARVRMENTTVCIMGDIWTPVHSFRMSRFLSEVMEVNARGLHPELLVRLQMWLSPSHLCDHLSHQPHPSPAQHRNSKVTHKLTQGMPSADPWLHPVWRQESWHRAHGAAASCVYRAEERATL